MGATDTIGRVLASVGVAGQAEPRFEAAVDVAKAGVLFALPALLANGLLSHTETSFTWREGYYNMKCVFMLLAFMALQRIRTPEALRYQSPGELGKALGLDRIPEVRTLRAKIKALSGQETASQWGAKLCEDWMAADPEAAGVLYLDGHVRVYHGHQAKLPRHYVTRERLCLRATADYWVNDSEGQPFFRITKPVDPGMLAVLRDDIIPRVLRDVPNQPSDEQLASDPTLHKLTLVFDREGYSPDFFRECKDARIACISYHKHPGDDWPKEEFAEHTVRLGNGDEERMLLAERGSRLSNGLWVRQVRKLSKLGHQTSVIATEYVSDLAQIAGRMFARWTQENFFRYMREHFGLDSLADYKTASIPEATKVVNPARRALESKIKSKTSVWSRKVAAFGALEFAGAIDPAAIEPYERRKSTMKQELSDLRTDIDNLKLQRNTTPAHIAVSDLPEAERFRILNATTKDFLDTIKMVAYRAETAMAHIVREQMARHDDARSLLRQIYSTEADIVPNASAGTLTIRLHHLVSQSADAAARHLCDELNDAKTKFPGTQLVLVYELLGSK